MMLKIIWGEVLGSVKLGGGFQNHAKDYLVGGSGFRQTGGRGASSKGVEKEKKHYQGLPKDVGPDKIIL